MVAVQHRRPSIRFDDVGISVQPWLFSAFTMSWADIDFISPIPTYERTDQGWQATPMLEPPRPGKDEDPGRWLVEKGILALQVAVLDRHALPRWTRLVGSVYMKPLLDEHDRPEPKRGVVTLELDTRRLSPGVEALFDLISEHCRFDLIVSF